MGIAHFPHFDNLTQYFELYANCVESKHFNFSRIVDCINDDYKKWHPLSSSEIRKQERPADAAKHRIVAQSCQIQGGGSHALLCGMQEPPTQKMAALSQIMRACFIIEEGL